MDRSHHSVVSTTWALCPGMLSKRLQRLQGVSDDCHASSLRYRISGISHQREHQNEHPTVPFLHDYSRHMWTFLMAEACWSFIHHYQPVGTTKITIIDHHSPLSTSIRSIDHDSPWYPARWGYLAALPGVFGASGMQLECVSMQFRWLYCVWQPGSWAPGPVLGLSWVAG